MTLGDKLAKLRKENNLTQEQLANILGVSRQAVSKWESDAAYPETDKLIRMSELFHCTVDYLLKDAAESKDPAPPEAQAGVPFPFRRQIIHKKSEKTLWGMPLWHIAKDAHGFVAIGVKARGVIAIGLMARGVVSLGLVSLGVVSIGLLALGLLAFGTIALGVLAVGSFAAGLVAYGAVCFGVFAVGAVAIGEFSAGALAMGKYFAIGDHAHGMIAVGQSRAVGSLYQKVGSLSPEDITAIQGLLDAQVPAYLTWAKEFMKLWMQFFV